MQDNLERFSKAVDEVVEFQESLALDFKAQDAVLDQVVKKVEEIKDLKTGMVIRDL